MAEPPRQKRRRSLVQDARKLQRLASTGDPENPSFHANALLSTPKSSAHKAYAVSLALFSRLAPTMLIAVRRLARPAATRSNADVMAVLLDRLDQVERTIEGLHRKLDYQRAEPGERSAELRKMPIPGNLDNGVTFPPRQMLGKKFSSANSIRPDIEFDEILDSGQGYPTPMPHSRGALMAREEIRPPLPDLLATTTPTDVMDLMPFVDDFLEHPRALFPLTCKSTAYNVAGIVRSEGLLTNIRSCYALLMVALSKAFSDCSSTESGLSDFQLANSMLGRLNAQLSLEYVQVLILSSLFLLKKGRLINFSMALHTACTSLYTLILRDNAAGVQRNKTERNNIMASYWICYNLEHELILEIDETLSQSSLCLLEENFPLPLGCDIPHNANLPPRIRDEIMLFMAEMSLKRILNRALTTSKPTAYSLDTSTPSHSQGSTLILELQNQVHDWLVCFTPILAKYETDLISFYAQGITRV
ncbi:hypothetical protein UA08_03108 [Talaromyces atroroseus]|uniref:Transcription factor domain-containing protein n=1 Tax=Talaromyces atroroseus TaxID=1441469 RepID=A0A225B0L2_TALAT|nr:hypothetical protein UA08_03108 [Talaromyces atroroseus]OKL61509.1 hypothetical protein UA08_03108 [Talaromyces atroroseus]